MVIEWPCGDEADLHGGLQRQCFIFQRHDCATVHRRTGQPYQWIDYGPPDDDERADQPARVFIACFKTPDLMQPLRPSMISVAVDVSPLCLFVRKVRADSRRLLRLKCGTPNTWLVWCLLDGLLGFVPGVSAQPELFGGNPDSSAFLRIPPDTDDWTRHFRIGALVGMNISANFSCERDVWHFRQQPVSGDFRQRLRAARTNRKFLRLHGLLGLR